MSERSKSLNYWLVVRSLIEDGGGTTDEIAGRVGLDRSVVSSALSNLKARGEGVGWTERVQGNSVLWEVNPEALPVIPKSVHKIVNGAGDSRCKKLEEAVRLAFWALKEVAEEYDIDTDTEAP